MRRTERFAAFAFLSLALGGCMVIYPDPELPDVVARWYEDDCHADSSNVVMTLAGVDTCLLYTSDAADE